VQRGGKIQKEVKNFGGDLKDGLVYAALFNALAPQECRSLYGEAQAETDVTSRAQLVLDAAAALGIDEFKIRADDIVKGNDKV
jgi:hypothetical protein